MDGADTAEREWRLITRVLLTQWETTLLLATMVLTAHRAMAAVVAGPRAAADTGTAGGDDGDQG